MEKATDYAAVIEGQRTGKIDVAMYGPLSYVVARNSGVRITPVGAQVEAPGTAPGYRAYGLVRADSPIQRIEDFRGAQVSGAWRPGSWGWPTAGSPAPQGRGGAGGVSPGGRECVTVF
ncbi:PhnD/SsuA/transferrin family substrate-binding protein [Saccharopolyspora sp. NPDC000359]|uniref:PhnD/SsuA/transferrin family substrate-binding protein n=1 Tax=Saccharopolyspora sp. NPDC000359 TaxID=3154251 RepID=UPI0033254E0A